MLQELKINETPVRTSRNLNINNTKIQNIEIPETIGKFENVNIIGQVTEDVKGSYNLTYGLGNELENQVQQKANRKFKIVVEKNKNQNVEIDFKSINVILYILNKVKLNRTQLMKYLFAIDFLNYKLFNKSISEFKYAHATYGPIVNDQDALINLLIKQDYIKLESSFIDNSMLFVPLQKADLSNFSEQEINVLNKIINNFKGMSANELTDWSHAFIGWIKTKDGEIIDFKYAKELDI